MHLNVYDRVQRLAGIIQCNYGKLEEVQDFKFVFVNNALVRVRAEIE